MTKPPPKSEAQSLRDALIAAEPANAELLTRYKKETANMLDKKLSLWSRIAMGLFGAYLLSLGIPSLAVFTEPMVTEPPSMIWLWGIAAVAMVSMGGLLLFIGGRGAYRQRREGLAFATIAITVIAAAGIQCMRVLSELGGEDFEMFVWRVGGAGCLALVGLIGLLFVRGRTATRLEMRLLEIEYRLALLSEKLENSSQTQQPARKA